MAIYHVHFVCAPDYMARRLPFRPAHLKQLVSLRDDGRVVAGGPEPDGTAANIFYRVVDRSELDRLLAENEFNRAGLFTANRPRAFADFVEPRERPPVDAGLSAIIVEGAPGDRAKARAGLTGLQREGRVAFGGFFEDGTALAVVRATSQDEALAWLARAGWDPARLVGRDWSQTLQRVSNSLRGAAHLTSWSPYTKFTRAEWARLRAGVALTLTAEDVVRLQGLNEPIALDEVVQIYLPLARLLSLYVEAERVLYRARATFLGDSTAKVPYVIGLAGSVGVGKSTTARILRELLARGPQQPKVDLVTTDGFLHPRRILEERGLMGRKGFPESYDRARLISFLADVKGGQSHLACPVYSHLTYDIVPGAAVTIDQPDIVILEGLNVLQVTADRAGETRVFVSDFFDFSIYVDAVEGDIRRWYVERFLLLRATAFKQPESYFHRYASLSDEAAEQTAATIWDTINGPNLQQNILPTRERAHLVLVKGRDHRVDEVWLRKL